MSFSFSQQFRIKQKSDFKRLFSSSNRIYCKGVILYISKTAHAKGAHWCNYGWSANQMALYPIQQDQWEKLHDRDKCGKPGINGGYFSNASLRFGNVSCNTPSEYFASTFVESIVSGMVKVLLKIL